MRWTSDTSSVNYSLYGLYSRSYCARSLTRSSIAHRNQNQNRMLKAMVWQSDIISKLSIVCSNIFHSFIVCLAIETRCVRCHWMNLMPKSIQFIVFVSLGLNATTSRMTRLCQLCEVVLVFVCAVRSMFNLWAFNTELFGLTVLVSHNCVSLFQSSSLRMLRYWLFCKHLLRSPRLPIHKIHRSTLFSHYIWFYLLHKRKNRNIWRLYLVFSYFVLPEQIKETHMCTIFFLA